MKISFIIYHTLKQDGREMIFKILPFWGDCG
jgi:hypothetical protein